MADRPTGKGSRPSPLPTAGKAARKAPAAGRGGQPAPPHRPDHAAQNHQAVGEILDVLRHSDPDRLLLVGFLPAAERLPVAALYALNAEIAKTRAVVSEAMLGSIRLQWWRDALDELFAGERPRHQCLQPLADPARHGRISRPLFDTILDARELDLDDAPFRSLDDLVAYAEATTAPLAYLAAELCAMDGPETRAALRRVSIAYALVGLMRAVPFHAQERRHFLPEELLRQHGVNPARLFDLKPGAGLPGVVAAVLDRAATELDAVPKLTDRARRPLLLPGVLARYYLRRLRRFGCDPFDRRVALRPVGRIGALIRAQWFGRAI